VSWPLRRNRDFAIFFVTQGISNIGDAASGLLIPLFVLQLTHNPLQVSAVAALEIATFIGLRIPFGAVSDLFTRRGYRSAGTPCGRAVWLAPGAP
jgi:hypothetical protein